MEEKRARGLCYYCDEKFGPGHRCNKKLFTMDLCMEDCEELKENEEIEEEEPVEEPHLKCKINHLRLDRNSDPEIKLKVITGEPLYDTINVTGDTGGGQRILMLVDLGSTHSFLDTRVAEQLGNELEEIREFQVSLADGQLIKGSKKCSCLTWKMEEEYFQDEFLVLPLKDYDDILGVQWLQPLKQVTWDFEAKTLNFQYNGRHLIIPATPTQPIKWVKEEKIQKTINRLKFECREKCYLLTNNNLLVRRSNSGDGTELTEMEGLLDEY